jgi:serpin B
MTMADRRSLARRGAGRALVVATGLAWVLTVGACTTPAPGPAGTVVATGSAVQAPAAREQAPAVAAVLASTAIAELGADLYHGIGETERGKNVVFSPLSIETALAMVRNGAAGQTRQEMDAVLSAGSGELLDRSLNALDTALAAHDGPVRTGGPEPVEIGLRTSNALWAQEGFILYAAFLDVLARHYGAGVQVVDYETATEAARQRINAFVSERTNGKIPQLLPPDALDSETRLVLTNTVWLKAPWARPFTAFGDQPFTRADGSAVPVPTMRVAAGSTPVLPGRYGEGPGWKAAELPYAGEGLSMVVIVPDDLAAFESSLDGPGLLAITGGLGGELQSVQMPRWSTRTSASLPDQLGALGMRRAFTDAAEFPLLSPEPTMIDDVLHQAFIAVDEKGTEAAAATAVISGPASIPVYRGAHMVVDRPFVYAIRDRATGAVLFLGRVVDPSVTAS